MIKGKKVVFVGLSGGVDSAVSAALLKKEGYEVVGVFIKTWHPNFLECNEEEERRDAMRVAAHLDIPFLTFDLEDIYKKEVGDYMIAEYRKGRTPNPDVMCNKEVKFGAFLKKAILMGALVRPLAETYVATGHYANLTPSPSPGQERVAEGWVRLKKGRDPLKDQSYFLWTLQQEQLKRILFPVGHLKKTEVRRLAKKFNLPVAEKKDSQGICFLGDIDLKEFLKHYIKEKKGEVRNEKGEVVGHHNGVVFSTLGERHGFTITQKSPNDRPYYIVGKDVKKNILTVSQYPHPSSPYIGGGAEGGRGINLQNTNWISSHPISYKLKAKSYSCQIRYHGEFLPCKIICGSRTSAKVIFNKPVLVAPGQSCVIYDGDICLGGGVVV